MQCKVFNFNGSKLLEVKEAEPECGVDFCDSCGDCLHCYGGDPCTENEDGQHLWVTYDSTPPFSVITKK